MGAVKTVLGNVGDRIEDGVLGKAIREFADIAMEYLQNDKEHNIYASLLADKGLDISHYVVDLLEELGLVNPDQD